MKHKYASNYLIKIATMITIGLINLSFSLPTQVPSFVYSSQYERKHDISEPQGIFNKIKVAKDSQLVFIAAGDSGIKVIDPKQNYDIIYTFRSTDYIEGFSITKDARYIFLPYDNKLTIFEFQNKKEFIQISQDSIEVETIDFIINDSEDFIFIIQSNGIIRSLNIKDKYNPKFAGQTSWHLNQIYDGFISFDDKWLFISQDIYGLAIFRITKNSDGTLVFVLAGSYEQSGSNAIDITGNMNYIINIDSRMGISIGDFSILINTPINQYPKSLSYLVKEWWPINFRLPSPYSLCISGDDNYLFIGAAQNIFIIDISKKTNFVLFQTIIIPFHVMSIKLSNDESDLFIVNTESMFVFRKIKPNLNTQYLNLFNNHISNGFSESVTDFYWRCYIDDIRNLYFGAFDDDGLWIIDISDPQNMNTLKKQFKPKNSSGIISKGDIDGILFLKNFKYMVVPVVDGTNILAVYDISNIQTPPHDPIIVQFIPLQTVNYIVDFDINQTEGLIVAAIGDSVVFIDAKIYGSFKVINQWNFEPGMKGDCTGVMLTKSDDYLIGASRGYGYFILDIKDLNNIKMLEYYDSLGAENVFRSDLSNDYCYFVDGLRGILIVDLKQLPKISIISQIKVPGWSNDITLIQKETIMLISTTEKSMLTMVDISNIHQPFLVTEYLYETQNGMSSCALKNNEYIFINNNKGIRALPTRGNVLFHTEIQEIVGFSDEINSFQYKKIDPEEVLQVGKTVQLDITFLYQQPDIVINKIQLYHSQKLFDLPQWITYNSNQQSIKINVIKNSIDPFKQEQPFLNIIIVQTIKPLYKKDFKYTSGNCQTTDDQVDAIYDFILDEGILDDINIVNPDLDYPEEQVIKIKDDKLFPDSKFNLCLSNLIKYTLLNSIQYTPIYLKMQSSLIFNPSPKYDEVYLSTISQIVTINIKIPKYHGQFICKSENSVKVQINDNMNELYIKGVQISINSYLKNNIIIFPINNQKFNLIQAKLTIEDNINYPIEKTLPISSISFIKEKQNISINHQQLIQNQFEETYPNSEIEILSKFIFEFDEDTFISPDLDVVKYTVFIEQDGQFIPLDSNHWLIFNPENQKFFGNPPATSIRDVLKIKIVGSDGYTTVSDTFQIHINKLPVLYVIAWIMKVLGPIIVAICIYKYRKIFYNALFKRKNRFSQTIAQVNQQFILKIPLISIEIKQAKQMIESLITKVQHSSGYEASSIELKLLSYSNIKKIHISQTDDFEKEQEQKQELLMNKKQDQESEEALRILGYDNNRAQSLTQAQSNFSNNLYQRKNWNTDQDDITENFLNQIMKAKEFIKTNEINKRYITLDGKIDMESISKDMLKFNVQLKVNGKEQLATNYKEELENKSSILHKCIKCQFARYFISEDHKSYLVSEYLKYYGKINSFNFTQNDWYKQFVKITSDNTLDINGKVKTFPKISLIIDNINKALIHLQLISSEMENLMTLKFYGINPYLIKAVLKAEALGINFTSPSSLFPAVGESIHLKSHQLRSVESFKYASSNTCLTLKRAFNVDYDPYGLKDNIQLPHWLNLTLQPGVIILQGTPQCQDTEDFLIRFYSTQGYIYKSFTLRIEDKKMISQDSQIVQRNIKQKNPSQSRKNLPIPQTTPIEQSPNNQLNEGDLKTENHQNNLVQNPVISLEMALIKIQNSQYNQVSQPPNV